MFNFNEADIATGENLVCHHQQPIKFIQFNYNTISNRN